MHSPISLGAVSSTGALPNSVRHLNPQPSLGVETGAGLIAKRRLFSTKLGLKSKHRAADSGPGNSGNGELLSGIKRSCVTRSKCQPGAGTFRGRHEPERTPTYSEGAPPSQRTNPGDPAIQPPQTVFLPATLRRLRGRGMLAGATAGSTKSQKTGKRPERNNGGATPSNSQVRHHLRAFPTRSRCVA